jgi:hypothetical protein
MVQGKYKEQGADRYSMRTMFFLKGLRRLAFKSCAVAASRLNTTGPGEGGKSGRVDSAARSSMDSAISEPVARFFAFLDAATHAAFNLDERACNLAIT